MAYSQEEFEYYVNSNLKRENKDKFNYWAAVAGVGTVGALGFVPTPNAANIQDNLTGPRPFGAIGPGQRTLWGRYIRGLQHFEGLSPFQVFRTFRLSEFLSPLAPPSHFKYTPSAYSHLLGSPAFQDYISKTTGLGLSTLEDLGAFEKGIEFRRTGTSIFGELRVIGGSRIRKDVAMLSTGYGKGSGFTAEWFARLSGARTPKNFLNPFVESLGDIARAPEFVPIAAPHGRRQLAAQYAHTIASAGVGRLNLLLQSPFQSDLFKRLAKKAPFLNRLIPQIKEGSALKMLGQYSIYAGKIGLAVHGIKYLDYLQRQDSSLLAVPRNTVVGGLIGAALTKSAKGAAVGAAALGIAGALPIFGEGNGFIGGLLDVYAKARIDLAKISTPWRAGSRRAEENFQGITDVKTLVGFAGTGLLLGGAYDHFDRIRTVSKTYKSTKASGNILYELADDAIKAKREALSETFAATAEALQGTEKLAAQWIGKWAGAPGYKKGLVAGAGIFGGLSVVGSLVSGDFLGAATTAAGFGAAGVAWAKGHPILAGLSMLATFALRGDKTPQELERIYSGEQLVPIRRGRWWEMGKSPFEGKRPYYRKHRIALAKTHAREKALYGSEKAYWESDPLLNPYKFLTDPYEREKLMWEQGWRFPVSQAPFEDFPILGPVLSATIGQLIKPTRLIEPEMWMDPASIGPAPPGYENLPERTPTTRAGIGAAIGNQLYNLTEAIGLPGFIIQSLTERLTGDETLFTRPQLMSPQSVAGIEPGYWSLNLGGLAGTSEVVRRFIPHRRSDVDLVNPLPSGLPSWLPQGPNSDYFIDFSRADVYTKFEEPWARLPGPGLAAARFPELKGINPEDYPAYYRFMVLADISPWSQEYKRYSSFMSQLSDSGQLTPEQMMTVQETKRQVAEVKKRKDFDLYKYDMDQVRRQTVTITGQVEPGMYLTREFGSAPISLAGINTSTAALARVAKLENPEISGAEAFRRAEKKRIQVDDYIREKASGGKLDVYIHSDPSMMMKSTKRGPIVPAIAIGAAGENLNRELEQIGLAERMEEDESVLANMAGVSFAQRAFGSFWENLLHGMESPLEVLTPISPTSKFINQKTPLEDYQRSRIYAREMAMWDQPISHFIAPGLRTVAWWAGWRGLPNEVKQRYMIEEYFDRLEYEKQKRLESAAIAAGQGDAAAQYAANATRTMTGADKFSAFQVYMALPKAERDYFKAFVEAPTKKERQEIARYVSPQMREALEAQWLRREMEGAKMRLQAGIGGPEERQLIQQYWAKKARINRRRPALPERDIPAANWVGFNPSVQMSDVKLKTVLDQNLDMFDYGFWPSDVRELERRPYIQPIGQAFSEQAPSHHFTDIINHYREELQIDGSQGYDSYTVSATGSSDIVINSTGQERVRRYLRDPTISTFGY